MRSGNNPIAQVIKRLSEEKADQVCQLQQQTSVSLKHPNNGYVCGSSCYVVVDEHHESDEHGKKICFCAEFTAGLSLCLANLVTQGLLVCIKFF